MASKVPRWIAVMDIMAILFIMGVVAYVVTKQPAISKYAKKFILPDPDELYHVQKGDSMVVYETDTSLNVEFYHSFRRHVCGEKLYIYTDDESKIEDNEKENN